LKRNASSVNRTTPKKILIVEDDEHIVELFYAIFNGLVNYRTTYVKNGREALRVARVEAPDIILLDIHLPELDGYEVCRFAKSDPAMFRTRVLMISGMAQNIDLLKAQEAGADGYITKPFIPTELIEKVEALLGKIEGINGTA